MLHRHDRRGRSSRNCRLALTNCCDDCARSSIRTWTRSTRSSAKRACLQLRMLKWNGKPPWTCGLFPVTSAVPCFDGIERFARGDPDFAIDRGQVPVDGTRTDDELFGYLGVGEPLGHQAQHFDFTCGQASWIGRGLLELWATSSRVLVQPGLALASWCALRPTQRQRLALPVGYG